MRYPISFLLVLFFTSFTVIAQKDSTRNAKDSLKPIQISGIIVTNDSIAQFVPYAHVVVKRKNRGTISNAQGFFSMAALPGDSLRVSTIGFKTEYLVIPDTLTMKEYLARVRLVRDTSLLEEVTLYPWPTPDQFKNSFLATRVPTTEEDIAMRNLAVQELKARAAQMGYSAQEMQDYVIKTQQQEIYNFGRYGGFDNGGTAILGSLTNPFAWAEFFEALKRGDFNSK